MNIPRVFVITMIFFAALASNASGWSMSALPPEADIRQRIEHVCFVPITDMLASASPIR
jgi:hypothetical protein